MSIPSFYDSTPLLNGSQDFLSYHSIHYCLGIKIYADGSV